MRAEARPLSAVRKKEYRRLMRMIDISLLSTQERLELIGELWDSLDQSEFPLTEEQKQELEKRLATADQDLADAVSWKDLQAEIARRRR